LLIAVPGAIPIGNPAENCENACKFMDRTPLHYFDYNATTRIAPEVVEAMLPFLTEHWGNPSSAYWFGHQLAERIDDARGKVAALINAEPREIIFTSCGTESINSALQSALITNPEKTHIVTTAVARLEPQWCR
jgi:cysteine desulfurase